MYFLNLRARKDDDISGITPFTNCRKQKERVDMRLIDNDLGLAVPHVRLQLLHSVC